MTLAAWDVEGDQQFRCEQPNSNLSNDEISPNLKKSVFIDILNIYEENGSKTR